MYFIEQHATYYGLARELMGRIEAGKLTAVASTLVLTELLVPAFRRSADQAASTVRTALEMLPNLGLVEVTSDVATLAAQLRAKYNLRTPDAVHVATAIQSGAKWLITNDFGLRRVAAEGIGVWLFDENV